MNSEKNIKKRILKLFSSELLKNEFKVAGSKSNISDEIAEFNPLTTIEHFSVNKIEHAKQHVHIYSIDKSFIEQKKFIDNFPLRIISHKRENNGYIFKCLPIIEFSVTVMNSTTNTFSRELLNFPQPTVIAVSDKHIIIHSVIMESSMITYSDNPTSSVNMVKRNITDDFTGSIVKYFLDNDYQVIECNLDKGVKYLTDNNVIDFIFMATTEEKSSRKEAMNEGYTFKAAYPKSYESAMKQPLQKSGFKYLGSDELLPKHFAIDSGIGKISITLYPTSPKQIENVVRQILSNN